MDDSLEIEIFLSAKMVLDKIQDSYSEYVRRYNRTPTHIFLGHIELNNVLRYLLAYEVTRCVKATLEEKLLGLQLIKVDKNSFLSVGEIL